MLSAFWRDRIVDCPSRFRGRNRGRRTPVRRRRDCPAAWHRERAWRRTWPARRVAYIARRLCLSNSWTLYPRGDNSKELLSKPVYRFSALSAVKSVSFFNPRTWPRASATSIKVFPDRSWARIMRYETSHLCSRFDGRSTPAVAGRASRYRGFYRPTLPDLAGQRRRHLPNGPGLPTTLFRTHGSQCRSCLCPRGLGLFEGEILPTAYGSALPGRTLYRPAEGSVASSPPSPRQSDQPVDLGVGRRGLLWQRLDPAATQRRSHPRGLETPGHPLAAGQALDHQPRSGIRAKKKARDRLIRLAQSHPDWVLGFQDETWWSRLALPALHAWSADEPLRLVERSVGRTDPDPKALCCYGL